MAPLSRRSRRTPVRARSEPELTAEQRAALPPRFVAAGEALAGGRGSAVEACWVVGRDLAGLGAPLGDCLDGLRTTTRRVVDRDPTFEEVHALSSAWSEATLGYLHGLSCSDPLTGLATLTHVRTRIADLYRDARADRHALVVTEARCPGEPEQPGHPGPVATARRMTLLGQSARAVFSGEETIGRVGRARLVVVAARDDALVPRVSLLRRMIGPEAGRVWIEGLPHTDGSAACLLDELARGV